MEVLKHLNIGYDTFEHPALFSVSDREKHAVNIPGLDTKNLFLFDRKTKQMVLVCMRGEIRMKISELQKQLGLKKLSFGSEELLMDTLGVQPGTVSVLCLLEKKPDLILVLDQAFKSAEQIGFHPPGDNTKTLVFKNAEFAKILEIMDLNFDVRYMNFSP